MPITKKFLAISPIQLTSQTIDKEQRHQSQPNLTAILPERCSTGNSVPWIPPQQYGRTSSVQPRRPYNQHLAPLSTPADIHRQPLEFSQFTRDSSSRPSLRTVSATSSPTYSSGPSSVYNSPVLPDQFTPSPVSDRVRTLPIPRSAGSSPTDVRNKRKSWFGGSKQWKKDDQHQRPAAWVLGHPGQQPPYDLTPLLAGEKVTELWNPRGNTCVHLFPRASGKGPSFRVDSSTYSSSALLTEIAHGKIYSVPGAGQSTAQLASAQRRNISMDRSRRPVSLAGTLPVAHTTGSPNIDPSEDFYDARGRGGDHDSEPVHLYLPIGLSADGAAATNGARRASLSSNDVDTLVSARNIFAFLLGQSLVATERKPSVFSVFLQVSDLLTRFGFSNLDGSTFGEVAHASFDAYVDELNIGDVRSSREKTIEGIVLGERLRSVALYNEAFVHGAGKYDELQKLESPKFTMITSTTRQRLERAHMDLLQRKKNINLKLAEFDFPAIFSGIMTSKTADEAKQVRFYEWRLSFLSTRKWFLGFYRHKYGAWPPKASSKKNSLETSGLNRLVLKDLYHDLSNLYDLIVDRNSLTTRTADLVMDDDDTEDAEGPMKRALRRVLGEYDRSTPPVQPPIPFDTPIIPSMTAIGDRKAEAKARAKKLKKDQLNHVLHDSYNKASNISTPFLDAFREYEYRQAEGSTISHIADLRQGQWIFLYAVLQSLPMLVEDAPGIKWAHGVEYFLCEPPRHGVPWVREDAAVYRNWYNISGGSGVVSLPSDVIEFGIEGVYRRSHCWAMAEKWTAHSELLSNIIAETFEEPLPMPPSFGGAGMMGSSRSRSSSPGSERSARQSKRQSVILLGLEAMPMNDHLAPGAPGSPHLRAVSTTDPTKTFDAILGPVLEDKKKGKKK